MEVQPLDKGQDHSMIITHLSVLKKSSQVSAGDVLTNGVDRLTPNADLEESNRKPPKHHTIPPWMSGIAMFMVPNVWCSWWCVMSISEGLCAWKASVYLSKRVNSSLLTKIFNGIGWEGCETQRVIIGWPLLFIVQWVIRNKAWFKHNYKTMWCMESPHDIIVTEHDQPAFNGMTHNHLRNSGSDLRTSQALFWQIRFILFGAILSWRICPKSCSPVEQKETTYRQWQGLFYTFMRW